MLLTCTCCFQAHFIPSHTCNMILEATRGLLSLSQRFHLSLKVTFNKKNMADKTLLRQSNMKKKKKKQTSVCNLKGKFVYQLTSALKQHLGLTLFMKLSVQTTKPETQEATGLSSNWFDTHAAESCLSAFPLVCIHARKPWPKKGIL